MALDFEDCVFDLDITPKAFLCCEYQDANDEFVREPKKIDADIFSDEEFFVRRDEPDIFEEEGEIIDLPASALRKDD